MRTNHILLAAAVLLTACANDAETTAPRSSVPSSTSTVSQKQDAAFPPGPYAKPTSGPVVITVTSPVVQIDGISNIINQAEAVCPAGTVLVGGGFRMITGTATFQIQENVPSQFTADAWRVVAISIAQSASFQSVARCIQ